MFGYVRPFRQELKVWEQDAYQGAYCGLCHTLHRRCGLVSRCFLNYDFVFLAMLVMPKEERPVLERRRCIACPLRGKNVCPGNAGLDRAADQSVILAYWKLQDSVADGRFWERMAGRAASLLLSRGYHRAAARQCEFDRQVRACLEELHRLEKERCPSMDQAADTFARILKAAGESIVAPEYARAAGELLYHVGRWIYLVDAWDDLAEDEKRGSYNPIHLRFAGRERQEQAYIRTTLRHSLNLARSACALLDLGCWSGIVENILYLGLPAVEELVFQGVWQGGAGGSLTIPGRE